MLVFILLANIIIGIVLYNEEYFNNKYSKLFVENSFEIENIEYIYEEENKESNRHTSIQSEVILDVSLISQMPELYNGCEITSLAMLLNYKGINVDKIQLASEMKRDDTGLIRNGDGTIYSWGNPDVGFVGEVNSSTGIGFSINPTPLVPLIDSYYSNGGKVLNYCTVEDIKESIYNDNPVLAWITADFTRPQKMQTWIDSKGNAIEGTFETHTVLLTGYDEENFYYNDPLNNKKNAKISIASFINIWNDMGSKALTLK